MKLIAINGRRYSTRVLRDEIAQAQQSKKPLDMRAQGDGVTQIHTVNYDGGLKYPHLIRAQGAVDYLDQIFAPKPAGS
jgi:hypothetical protein